MQIQYLSGFKRQYKRLSREVQIAAEKKEKIFRKDPFDSRLKTHKLKGELEGYWAFSINFSYRIIFQFADGEIMYFYRIGKHDIYD